MCFFHAKQAVRFYKNLFTLSTVEAKNVVSKNRSAAYSIYVTPEVQKNAFYSPRNEIVTVLRGIPS